MQNLIKKFTSRKFLTAAAGIIVGIILAFGADGGAAGTIAGAAMAVISLVVYIITEGRVDAKAVLLAQQAAQAVGDAVEAVQNIKDDEKAEEVPAIAAPAAAETQTE